MKRFPEVIVCLMFLSSFGFAQFGTEMKTFSMAKATFTAMDTLPKCATVSPVNGDATKDVAFLAAKMTAGCVIPWHWHSSDENVTIVSGRGKIETKGGAPEMVTAGDYAYFPSKQQHQFTCPVACSFFVAVPQAFDIHYVDQNGNEIPPEQALKANTSKGAGKKATGSAAKPPNK